MRAEVLVERMRKFADILMLIFLGMFFLGLPITFFANPWKSSAARPGLATTPANIGDWIGSCGMVVLGLVGFYGVYWIGRLFGTTSSTTTSDARPPSLAAGKSVPEVEPPSTLAKRALRFLSGIREVGASSSHWRSQRRAQARSPRATGRNTGAAR